MRTIVICLLLALPIRASELSLAREMLDDAVIRDDADGMQLVRERLERIAAGADDKTVRRDAHYLAALSALFESFSGRREGAATGRRFGLWDAEAHAWTIMVRLAQDAPRAETLRPMAAQLMQQRPDFALGRQLADAVAERRFVAAPPVPWQSFLTDAAGDGKNPTLPDIVSVDRAQDGDRMWYRITFHDPLPRSFGVNLVVNRSGDPFTGMKWWGGGSTFRFDRLLTAWITRDGDRYFGRVGVTDDDGAPGARLAKIPAHIQLAMA